LDIALPPTRQQLEAQALQPFTAVATELGLACVRGQGLANRLPIKPNVYFQFGDLRVGCPTTTIVVEVESSGGVTNGITGVEYAELTAKVPGTSLNLLYAPIGAMEGVHWQEIKRTRRTAILLRLDEMGIAPD
jgi:hypothetical protein